MMTEAELKHQRSKAAANWELKKMLFRANRATQAEIDEAKRILDELKAYQIPIETPDVKPAQATTPAPPAEGLVIPAMAVSEFTSLLETLTIERSEAHKQMALRSNTLADFPDDANLKELVNEIQEWKAKRNALGEKIAYLKTNGRLPDPEPVSAVDHASDATKSAFLANLPADRYDLNLLLVNSLRPKLSRAKKGLAGAKTDLWRSHYEKQVAIAQAEVDLVKGQISAFA